MTRTADAPSLDLGADRLRRQSRYLIGAIVVVAALIRIVLGVVHNPGVSLYSDMANYDAVAEHIRHGQLSAGDTFYPIGYPAFLATIYTLTNRNFTAVAIIQALLGAATCWLAAAITGRLTSSKTAPAIAAATVMVYPPLVYYGAMLLTESVAPFWFTLSVWCLLRTFDKPSIARTGAAGVSLAMATLIRPNFLVLYPFIAIVAVRAHGTNVRLGLRAAAQIIVFAAPLLLAASAVNSTLLGRMSGLSTNGGVNFFLLQSDVFQLRHGDQVLIPVRNSQFSETVDSPVPFFDERYFYGEGVKAFRGRPDKIRHTVNNVLEGFGLGSQGYWPANQFYDFEDAESNGGVRRLLRWCSKAFFWILVLPIVLAATIDGRTGRLFDPSHAPTLLAVSILIGVAATSALLLADPRIHVPFDPVLIAFITAIAMRGSFFDRRHVNGDRIFN